MTRPFFSRDRVTEFDNFERHADIMIKLLKERLQEGYAVDFQVCKPAFVPLRQISNASSRMRSIDLPLIQQLSSYLVKMSSL